MMAEDTPMFAEMLEKYPGLFDNDAEWQALVADPEHELVPVPPPSFSELLDQLKGNLPDEVIAATWSSVDNERAWNDREEAGDGGDEGDRPADDAAGPEPAGDGVVGGDGEPGGVGADGGDGPARGGDPVPGDGGEGPA